MCTYLQGFFHLKKRVRLYTISWIFSLRAVFKLAPKQILLRDYKRFYSKYKVGWRVVFEVGDVKVNLPSSTLSKLPRSLFVDLVCKQKTTLEELLSVMKYRNAYFSHRNFVERHLYPHREPPRRPYLRRSCPYTPRYKINSKELEKMPTPNPHTVSPQCTETDKPLPSIINFRPQGVETPTIVDFGDELTL